jgi:hypothetical protein
VGSSRVAGTGLDETTLVDWDFAGSILADSRSVDSSWAASASSVISSSASTGSSDSSTSGLDCAFTATTGVESDSEEAGNDETDGAGEASAGATAAALVKVATTCAELGTALGRGSEELVSWEDAAFAIGTGACSATETLVWVGADGSLTATSFLTRPTAVRIVLLA